MTLSQLITFVDELKRNVFSPQVKTVWVNECEGMIQTDILLLSLADVVQYSWETDQNTQLLVQAPHDKLYRYYLEAMICYEQEEYDRYGNCIEMFNRHRLEYVRFVAERLRPQDGRPAMEVAYLSAYAIAVKHGYVGTEAEWTALYQGAVDAANAAAVVAQGAAQECRELAVEIPGLERSAAESAAAAREKAAWAGNEANRAKAEADRAAQVSVGVVASVEAAQIAREDAVAAANSAAADKLAATTAKESATASAVQAKNSEVTAADWARQAGECGQRAEAATLLAQTHAASASGSAQMAKTESDRSQSEANRAKAEADRAAEVVGGDFATKAEAQRYAAEAESAAKAAAIAVAAADATAKANTAEANAKAASEPLLKTQPTKDTFSDADSVPLIDSAASNATKRITWANIKPVLKSYFDGLYAAISHSHAWNAITGKPSSFAPSAHKDSHRTGGTDALAPADIGAAAEQVTSQTASKIWPAGTAPAKPTVDLALGKLACQDMRHYIYEEIHTSTEWVAPQNIENNEVTIICVGGGGSGMNAGSQTSAGGGGGHIVIKKISVVPGQRYPVTIGAGGARPISATGSPVNGKSGGTTSFSNLVSAAGGSGGSVDGTGGSGGSGGGGSKNGGSGSFGGGGGGGYQGTGGNGGTFGGGGGGAIGGGGGTYGGSGGSPQGSARPGQSFYVNTALFPGFVIEYQTSEGGNKLGTADYLQPGGGGACGRGGDSRNSSGGGGGFYCRGGLGYASMASGGGGGMFGNGGDSGFDDYWSGGGGGYFGAGGSGSNSNAAVRDGSRGGGGAGGRESGNGGNGLVALLYSKEAQNDLPTT